MNVVAVVPIFTSAGVALLPTIVAAVASMAAIVLKPRELLRLACRRPLAMGVGAGAVALGLAAAWLLAVGTSPRPSALAESKATFHCDWANVAEEIIAQEAQWQDCQYTGPRCCVGGCLRAGPRFFPLLLRRRAIAARA